MNPTYIALIISGLVLIFGGGTTFNSWKKNAVLEYRLDEAAKKVEEHTKELAALKSSIMLTDQRIEQIGMSLRKLDLLETVTNQMSLLMARTENILPRPEAETKFENLGQRVNKVESAIEHLEHPRD